MTLKVSRKSPLRLSNRAPTVSHNGSGDRAPSKPSQYEPVLTETSQEAHNLDDDVIQSDQSTWSLESVNNNALSVEKLGANLDPFESLPLKLHFSILKLMEYCM
jgi:hypothetical protein